MSVRREEARLLLAAEKFVATGDKSFLLSASLDYAREKMKRWKQRDNWKARQFTRQIRKGK